MDINSRALCLICCLRSAYSVAIGPQFRGPDGTGLCPSCASLPTEFGPQEKRSMENGSATREVFPGAAGDRTFVTASEGDELITLCPSRAIKREYQNRLNHRPALTAVTNGNTVFVFFFGLTAYDFAGKQRWQLPLGPLNSQHGVITRLRR